MDKDTDSETVKTTIELPRALWRSAKIRAMDTSSNLNALMIAALKAHLAADKAGR